MKIQFCKEGNIPNKEFEAINNSLEKHKELRSYLNIQFSNKIKSTYPDLILTGDSSFYIPRVGINQIDLLNFRSNYDLTGYFKFLDSLSKQEKSNELDKIVKLLCTDLGCEITELLLDHEEKQGNYKDYKTISERKEIKMNINCNHPNPEYHDVGLGLG